MKAVITGATGLLGANLAAALCAAGHRPVCTRRGPSRTAALADLDVAWVEADLSDEAALTRAFDGADVVFHCAAAVTVRRRPSPGVTAANVDGTRRVLAACRAAGVGRLVHTSSTVCVGLAHGAADADEQSAWDLPENGLADAYSTTKRAAEALVLAADDLDVVVVNPGFMLGPRDQRPSSGALLLELRRGAIPALTAGTNSFVDVRDVAEGMRAAAARGARGARYILGGHNLAYAEALPQFAAWMGCRAPRLRAPAWLGAPLGWIGDLQERFIEGEPFINSAVVRYGGCADFRFSSAKAVAALGYTIGPLEPAVRDALAWWGAHGMLDGPPRR
jgi:dihydroflavonol-4-reductase